MFLEQRKACRTRTGHARQPGIEAAQRLQHLADHDALTHVFNRRAFTTLFHKALSRCQRQNSVLALLAVDFDHFKAINDNYSHAAGDQVLKTFARIVEQHLRKEDTLARMGGEEFSILLPDTGRDEAVLIAERVRAACENATVTVNDKELHFTISIGIALTPPLEAEELLQIYNLEVVIIPTNRPMARIDNTDLVYLTKDEKYQAIIEDVKQFNPRCSFPTIIIGDKVIVGFKEKEIKEALGM